VYRIEKGMVAEIWKAGDVLGLLADMGVPAPNQTTAFGMLKFVAGMFYREARRRFPRRAT
jgi:hypothetical protein